ncbi:Chymotrypsinogen B [Acropora cervicornis]|uniref:Chymotrypsinogen B n=1 Tax=Acropora cervicornis TaxID=6130 RepID=A0AAD9V399_ACRCE|nr:Chymotrypsinogen B [Acropora cervicornis]
MLTLIFLQIRYRPHLISIGTWTFQEQVWKNEVYDPSCDFEKDLCGWTQSKSDNFDWKRQQRRTPSSYTGPSSGQGNTGAFTPKYRPPGPVTCGVSPMARVIGGADANPGNWPWQIALLLGGVFTCGGSLIAPDWIVTAAHCVASSRFHLKVFLNSEILIINRRYSRRWKLSREIKITGFFISSYRPPRTEETVQGKEIILHPEFSNPFFPNNDIALIRLVRPVKLGPRVGTVCLPAQDVGLLEITDKMICAGVEGEPLSGCHGDSGGPYVCQSPSGNWFLQGAVSWGSPTCAASERYSVFARVAQFRNWIRQHTGSARSN